MKNRLYATLFKLMAISLLVVSCQPESLMPEGMLRVSTEPLAQRGKAVVNGTASTWQDGDQIRFSNGTLTTVSVVDGNYYISQSGIVSGTSAVYPASIVKDAGAGVWTLTLPESYQYAIDGGGHQVVEMPLAAYYTGDGSVFFKHLTGGLYFTIINNTGSDVVLDRVTVENETFYMNGTTLPLSSIDAAFLGGDRVFAGSGSDAARKRVSLLFNDGYALASGSSKQFLVPVPAFGSDAAFTITVYAHNGLVSRYLFNQKQSVAHTSHISAAEVGYANISLGDNVQSHPFEGNGTYVSPYQIYTKEDYLRMVDSVNNGLAVSKYNTKYYDIAADINMGGETVDGLRSFAGVIDGKGHTISHVCFGNSNDSKDLGMVSTIYSDARDTIRNLTLDYVSFTAGGQHVGAFVGNAYVSRPYLVLHNCHLGHITYNTFNTSADVGGMVGYAHRYLTGGSLTLSGCSIDYPISLTTAQTSTCTGTLNFGGLAGAPGIYALPFLVTDCSINANLYVDAPTARLNAGGVTGHDGSASTYTNVTIQTGTVFTFIGKDQIMAGALIGQGSGDPGNYTNCIAQSVTINVTSVYNGNGNYWLGGLVGRDGGSNVKTFTNCTVSGDITVTKSSSSSTNRMGMVAGSGSSLIHWDDTDRGNSAAVTLTVTNDGSINDHLGNVYGEQENYGTK